MQIYRAGTVLGMLLAIAVVQGCGGGASSPPPPTITSVSVSPQNPMIASSQQLQFSATVEGTGDFSTAVTTFVPALAFRSCFVA
jgi:hypothetical protein